MFESLEYLGLAGMVEQEVHHLIGAMGELFLDIVGKVEITVALQLMLQFKYTA